MRHEEAPLSDWLDRPVSLPATGKCTWTVILPDGTVFTGTELKAPTGSPEPPCA